MKHMKQSHRVMKLLATGIAVLGLLAPTAAWAAPPLPVPSALFYGRATGPGGPMDGGTIKVILPGGSVISGTIGSLAGTGYNYNVAVPLGLPSAGTTLGAPGMAGISDTVRFYLNDTLAVFRDQSGITRGQFSIPLNGIGRAFLMDLALVGPESYPLGDVNASGVRDSADSLLVLRYDVGLTPGGNEFPPPPRTIYLPLCDIVEDSKCNSSDALRILQCDAGMPGVTCPGTEVQVSIASEPSLVTDTAKLALRTDFAAGPDAGQVTVRVLADDPLLTLGAATVDLSYDPAAMSDAACTANPAGSLDAAFCNTAFITGTVRVSAVSVDSAGPQPVLAAVAFRLAEPSVAATTASLSDFLSRTITLTAQAVFDANGEPLPWRVEGARPGGFKLYLPLVTRNFGEAAPTSTATATPSGTPSATPSPSATPTSTPSATASPTISATMTVTATADTPTPTATLTSEASATPTLAPTGTPVPTATLTPLPANTPTATPTPTLLPTATPTPAPSATPTAAPSVTPAARSGTSDRLLAILANLF